MGWDETGFRLSRPNRFLSPTKVEGATQRKVFARVKLCKGYVKVGQSPTLLNGCLHKRLVLSLLRCSSGT